MIAITGGAGFIGSHLVDRLVSGKVLVIDNLSSSKLDYIKRHIDGKRVVFQKTDIRKEFSVDGCDTMYHFAALPDVRESTRNPREVMEQNVAATINVLEACRKGDVKKIILASTSTVYGNAKIPTPEDHPLNPISNYGASKAACEVMLRGYSESYGITAVVLRYANIFGPRSNHGVARDLFGKLMKNNKELEIIGNGRQNKSYLYIDDCVDATLLCADKVKKGCEVINVGSSNQITVDEIVRIMAKELGLSPKIKYTGLSWTGDVLVMLLDTRKLQSMGWKQRIPEIKGLKLYIRWLKNQKVG